MVNRADSTYLGLIYGITREVGLSLLDMLEIVPVLDVNGDPVVAQPAIEFIDTKCHVYSDYDNGTIDSTFDRFDVDGNAWTVGDLVDRINETGIFTATLAPDAESQMRSMMIFNQKSIGEVINLDISEAGVKVVLPDTNLIDGTVAITSDNLLRRRDSEGEIEQLGDYFVDLQNGTIITSGAPAPGSIVRYQYRNDDFLVLASPVILHNLQSDDFKTKMFEQVTEDGETYNGLPTNLGADIVNELLSVYPSLWGK
jgi:hypothetical protein